MDILRKMHLKENGGFFLKNVFLLVTIFIVMVLLAGVIICGNFIKENDRKAEEKTARECEYLCITSDNMIDSIVAQMKNIVQFAELSIIFNDSQSDRYYYSICAETVKKVKNITDVNGNIDSIYLYTKHRDEVITNSGTLFQNIFLDNSWMGEYENSQKTEFKIFFRENDKKKTVLTLLYHLSSSDKTDGCIVVNIDIPNYIAITGDEGYPAIAEITTNEIICTGNANADFSLMQELISSDQKIIKAKGEYYGISKKQSQFGNFYYAYIQPYPDYLKNVITIFIQMLLILVVLMAFFVYIAFRIAEITYKPIKEIGEIIENPDSKESKKYLENDKNTKKIADKIFSVVYKNEMLCRELNEKMDNFNYAQLKALQWQINPHFIFNTLNMLYLVTEKIAGRGNKASHGILSLSKLMRYSLKTEPMVVPLYEELDAINEYVKIMSARLGDTFDFEITCDESLKNRHIIKMCIQPVLENAFRYGIKNLERKGIINVRFSEEDSYLKIVVTDNGHGMDIKKLQEIKASLEKIPDFSEVHIGLLNANSRLRLLYGDEYAMEIDSKENEGTVVTIKCPDEF